MDEKCKDWQNATIKGSIDNQGNFTKTKFLHKVLPWGRMEDAYKIEVNILGEMILKSKSRKFWKDQKFTFPYGGLKFNQPTFHLNLNHRNNHEDTYFSS